MLSDGSWDLKVFVNWFIKKIFMFAHFARVFWFSVAFSAFPLLLTMLSHRLINQLFKTKPKFNVTWSLEIEISEWKSTSNKQSRNDGFIPKIQLLKGRFIVFWWNEYKKQ